jgi:hypothetical protein
MAVWPCFELNCLSSPRMLKYQHSRKKTHYAVRIYRQVRPRMWTRPARVTAHEAMRDVQACRKSIVNGLLQHRTHISGLVARMMAAQTSPEP